MEFQGSHEWTKNLSCPVMEALTNIIPDFLGQEFLKHFWIRSGETTKVLGFCLALNSTSIFYLELLISSSSQPPLFLKEKITSKTKPHKKLSCLKIFSFVPFPPFVYSEFHSPSLYCVTTAFIPYSNLKKAFKSPKTLL